MFEIVPIINGFVERTIGAEARLLVQDADLRFDGSLDRFPESKGVF